MNGLNFRIGVVFGSPFFFSRQSSSSENDPILQVLHDQYLCAYPCVDDCGWRDWWHRIRLWVVADWPSDWWCSCVFRTFTRREKRRKRVVPRFPWAMIFAWVANVAMPGRSSTSSAASQKVVVSVSGGLWFSRKSGPSGSGGVFKAAGVHGSRSEIGGVDVGRQVSPLAWRRGISYPLYSRLPTYT
jgi:hypothetical protein